MADIYKTRYETANGDVVYFQTSADIVEFYSNKAGSLSSTNIQDAILEVENHVIENYTNLTQKFEQTTTNIINQITNVSTTTDAKAELLELTAVIKADQYVELVAPFTQTVSLPGVLETDIPIIGLNPTGDVGTIVKQIDAWCSVSRIQTMNDRLLVTCLESKPTVDLPIRVLIVRNPPPKESEAGAETVSIKEKKGK